VTGSAKENNVSKQTISKPRHPKGRLLLGYTVNCGKCGSQSQHFPDKKIKSADQVAEILFKEGWIQTLGYGLVCDICEWAKKEGLKKKYKKQKK
jgi:hypothetical protein